MEKLTRAQKSVLKDIFEDKINEEEAIRKENISTRVYELWFLQPLWNKEYEKRVKRCQRKADLIITTYKEVAALTLVQLTTCDKEAVARPACLDILSMEPKEEVKTEGERKLEMKQETQEAILNIMAGERKNKDERKE